MIIPTPQSVAQTAQLLTRRRRRAAQVLEKMKQGAVLYVTFHHREQCWQLSDGTRVSAEVASIVRTHVEVLGVGDCLFSNGTSQTFRHVE